MTAPATALGPILLRASLHETIWGGRKLARLAGKVLPEGASVGESWETALDAVAINAPYAAQTLGQLTEVYGEGLIGSRARAVFGLRFPLLTKFIDAQQDLSVQVHPNDEYAREHEGGKLGKTETWYILDAEPGATVVYGLARESTRDEVAHAIAETRLEHLLNAFEVQVGDVILVPAGTIHAIGSGVALYELQEYSDVTYRLYDYGRLQADGKPRELHVTRGLEVMRYGQEQAGRVRPVTVAQADGLTQRVLVGCRYFVLEELALRGTSPSLDVSPTSCQILSVLDGACTLTSAHGEYTLNLGQTVVLPAAMGRYTLSGEGARLVRSYVPTEDDTHLLAWLAAQDSRAAS